MIAPCSGVRPDPASSLSMLAQRHVRPMRRHGTGQAASRRGERRTGAYVRKNPAAKPTPRRIIRAMSSLPYWRLSGFYFFYFAFVGAMSPFWGLYLQIAGIQRIPDRRADVAAAGDADIRAQYLGPHRRPHRQAHLHRADRGAGQRAGVCRRVRQRQFLVAVRGDGRPEFFLERLVAAGRGDDAVASGRAHRCLWPHPAVGLGRFHRDGGGAGLRLRSCVDQLAAVGGAGGDAGHRRVGANHPRSRDPAASHRPSFGVG